MKVKNLLFTAVIILLAGCASTTPMPEAVKMSGEAEYKVTVLGDIHYDGPQYHESEPLTANGKRERERNFSQWRDGRSAKVLLTASKESRNTAPFIIQLGDITQGDCDNSTLQGAMYRGAFEVLHRFFPDKKIFALRGNHDGRRKVMFNDCVRNHFVPLLKKELGGDNIQMQGTNYAVRYGKDLYIFYDYNEKSEGDFTRKMIESNPDARHIFFLTHLPIFPCSTGNPGWVVPQFKELIPLLAKHKAIVLCAHTHFWGTFVYKCAEGTLPQLIVNSMGNNWDPGAPLKERYNSYAQWKANINPKYYAKYNQWSIDNLKFFKDSDFIHYQSYMSNPSGFVKLEVTDSKVIARIYTNSNGVPVKSVVLKENK